MCNYLHPKLRPAARIHAIPESGIAYKVTRIRNGDEETPFNQAPVEIGIRYRWNSSLGDGFTCVTALAEARGLLRRLAQLCPYEGPFRLHLVRYWEGLGERFEPATGVYCMTAIVREFEYGPVVE